MNLYLKEIFYNLYQHPERRHNNMKKMFYNIFVITSLIICSMFFVSCDAITAQNINPDSFSGMNGIPIPGGISGNPRIDDNPNRSAGKGRSNYQGTWNRSGKNRTTNENFMGEMMIN